MRLIYFEWSRDCGFLWGRDKWWLGGSPTDVWSSYFCISTSRYCSNHETQSSCHLTRSVLLWTFVIVPQIRQSILFFYSKPSQIAWWSLNAFENVAMTVISPLSGPQGARGFPDLLGYSQTTPLSLLPLGRAEATPSYNFGCAVSSFKKTLLPKILIALSPLQMADVTFREKSSLTILSKVEIPFNFF